MKVGFTGTREGMTDAQCFAFGQWLYANQHVAEFHHGCCVGADEFAACCVADESALPRPLIVGHPGDWGPLTSEKSCRVSGGMMPCRPMLQRNRDIVDASDVLIACPKGPEEQRSGTWATVRYARKQKKRIVIVWRDGTITEEN